MNNRLIEGWKDRQVDENSVPNPQVTCPFHTHYCLYEQGLFHLTAVIWLASCFEFENSLR